MKIAVVGGGIFGCTAAIHAARAGHDVDLYEKRDTLLPAASGCNQFRLHEGYHYPRSPETVNECRTGNISFRAEYGAAVVDGGRHLYAIAQQEHGSKTSARKYLEFLQRQELPQRIASVGEYLSPDDIDLVVEVDEGRIDYLALVDIVEEKIVDASVSVHLETAFRPVMGYDYDRVIIATYGNTNAATAGLPAYEQCRRDQFQFEVCEKPVVRMPDIFNGVSVVVMDGEFGCCVDPLGSTGLFVLGHVKHAIWRRNIGMTAEVPYHLVDYIDQGIVALPSHTKFDRFIDDGAVFIPVLRQAEHIGSMYTVRAVLPNRDSTDERPTLVEYLEKDKKYIRVFSGKIGTCVEAAKRAVEMLDERPTDSAKFHSLMGGACSL